MKKVYFLLFGFISVISFHCQKEVNYTLQNDNRTSVLAGKATIQGNIVDENGQAAAGTVIKSGDKTTTTDARGYFRIVGAVDDRRVSIVTAEKDGYFKAYRSFIPTTGVNQVVIRLLKKNLSGTINSTTGGDVSLPNGSKISLPAKSIVKTSGDTYEGAVNLYAAYIDPTSKDISETVPGSFMGDNKDGKRVSLTSYGMLAVQLESSSGEKLQLAPGNTATLTFLIPVSIQASAPSSISLWYIDEQTGIWKEQGTAAKNGNKYVGAVSHFSFWNCDTESSSITLSMTLRSTAGSPMIYTAVRLTTAGGRISYGWTDSLGDVSGLVPSDTALLMEVIALRCNNVVYSERIGPFNQSTDLGVVTIDTASSMVTIRGRLVNCSNSAVTNGYAIVSVDNIPRYVMVDNMGSFRTDIFICPGNAPSCQILGVDNTTQQQGNPINVNVATPETNAGDILACGTSSEQYINYTLDGKDYSLTSSANDSLSGYTYGLITSFHTIIVAANGAADYIYLQLSHDNSSGIFPLEKFGTQNFRDSSIVILQASSVTFTNNPQNPGEFYEGSISAKFTDQQVTGATVHNVSGTFRIRRQQ